MLKERTIHSEERVDFQRTMPNIEKVFLKWIPGRKSWKSICAQQLHQTWTRKQVIKHTRQITHENVFTWLPNFSSAVGVPNRKAQGS